MELRTCRRCGETKELKNEIFRFTCNRFQWICRDCQNEHKRKKYHAIKKRLTTPKIYQSPLHAKIGDTFDKYEAIFALEEKDQLSTQDYMNVILSGKDWRNHLKSLKTAHFKEIHAERIKRHTENFDRTVRKLAKSGISPDAPAYFVDYVLEKRKHSQERMGA